VAISLDQLMAGIAYNESRGQSNNGYGANNGIAVGKYQVLKSNVPGWSKQVLGYSISWQKFLNTPSLQEQIVRGILGGYLDRYGAYGAAAMWFSGRPDPNSRVSDGGMTVKQYVDQAIAHAGGGNVTDSGGTGDIPAVTPKLDLNTLADQFGFTSDFLKANPELLNKIFKPAIANGWDQATVTAKLKTTQWWKTHSDKERQYLTQIFNDPATAKANLSAAKVQVQQLAAQLGVASTAFVKKQLDVAAYNMVAKGWNEGQLRNFLGQYAYFGNEPGAYRGQGADTENELRSYAYSMGATMSNTWYADNTRQVLRGLATISDFKQQILKQTKAAFPQYAKQLDGGQTLADIASPYMQAMSQILELPPGSINLFDPTIKKALQYKDPGTLQTATKPLWQFQNDLRNDPRWKGTQNAQDGMMSVAHQVLQDFGFKT